MPKKVTKVRGITPLQALVVGRMTDKGWDPKTVEDRGVAHATLHRYMNPVELRQLPRRDVLEALARGLQLDVEDVRQAAVESLTGRPSTEWRGGLELKRQDDLIVGVVVERIDRMPISEEDLQRGLDLAAKALQARSSDYARAASKGKARGRSMREKLDAADEASQDDGSTS